MRAILQNYKSAGPIVIYHSRGSGRICIYIYQGPAAPPTWSSPWCRASTCWSWSGSRLERTSCCLPVQTWLLEDHFDVDVDVDVDVDIDCKESGNSRTGCVSWSEAWLLNTIFGNLLLFCSVDLVKLVNGPLAVFYISSSFEKRSSKTKINSQSSVNLSRILSILEVAETSYFWCLIPSEDSKIEPFCQLHHRRELIIGFRKPLSTSWLKANIW